MPWLSARNNGDEIANFFIDIFRPGGGAEHLFPKQFAVTLAQAMDGYFQVPSVKPNCAATSLYGGADLSPQRRTFSLAKRDEWPSAANSAWSLRKT